MNVSNVLRYSVTSKWEFYYIFHVRMYVCACVYKEFLMF